MRIKTEVLLDTRMHARERSCSRAIDCPAEPALLATAFKTLMHSAQEVQTLDLKF